MFMLNKEVGFSVVKEPHIEHTKNKCRVFVYRAARFPLALQGGGRGCRVHN